MHCAHANIWHLQKSLYNIRLKTGLFEVKLYYINFMRLFYQESEEIWRHEEHTVMRRKPRRQVSDFSSDFCCIKTIFTFLLQIIRSEWFLMFMLNVKNCFSAKKETLSSVYLLITEIYTYWSYEHGIALPRTRKSNSSEIMFYVHYNFHAQDYCDDWWHIWAWHLSGFMSTRQLQRVVAKWLLHRKCIGKIRSFIILS